MSDMKTLHTFTNVGDTLSSINFNFTCLDIKLCNLQHEANTKWNYVSQSDDWDSSLLETLAMSSNWEDVKHHVHSTSAYWDTRIQSVFYPSPFPEGQVSVDTVTSWINSTFPAANYREGQVFLIYFFEWYKDPRLHTPPANSVTRFGLMTEQNNVHAKAVRQATFELVNGKWVYSTKLHFPKECITRCDPCWGEIYYAKHPLCIPEPTYYMLSCAGPAEEPEVVITNPCDYLSITIDYDFPTSYDALNVDTVYQKLSTTNLIPYTLGYKNSHNPHLDEVSDDVYKRYIWESSQPIVDGLQVERVSAFHVLYTYQYVASAGVFMNETIFSSMCAGDFSLSANFDFPFHFKDGELKKYLKANGQGSLTTGEVSATSACPFRFDIDTTWYRWVSDSYALSASPYWHISTEPGSALGFYYNPTAGVPDTASQWASAQTVLGASGLSAYFGTYLDMMGKINDINVFALSS